MANPAKASRDPWQLADNLTLEEAVMQSIGAASVCWETTPTGVFDSARAKEVGDELIRYVRDARG